jgi:hypothetical protein
MAEARTTGSNRNRRILRTMESRVGDLERRVDEQACELGGQLDDVEGRLGDGGRAARRPGDRDTHEHGRTVDAADAPLVGEACRRRS